MERLNHPYENLTGGQWLRGNLHTHTLQSDGADMPQTVIDDYAARGYDFLSISDHDIVTAEEHYAKWDGRGMVLIPGNEVSAAGPHLLHVDPDRLIAPRSSRQDVINEINAAAAESGRGFVVVNHPNWGAFDHATIHQMREWTGYIGMEIYNGVICFLQGSPYATNKWDLLLSEGRRLWGFANDDSHSAQHRGLGWNVVYAKERSGAAIMEAMRAGRFYASTGVVISKIEVEGDTIRIETENARRICALTKLGTRIAIADGSSIEVKVPAGRRYVRFECWGDGESFAWTQPFYIEEQTATGKPGHEFLEEWQVTTLLAHGTLPTATPEQAAGMATTPISCFGPEHAAAGFVEVRRITGGDSGIVYLTTDFESDAEGTRTLHLGFDGPIRVWINDADIFSGPGTNPAVRDELSIYVRLNKGSNRIVIALDTNGGKAYGIFARVE